MFTVFTGLRSPVPVLDFEGDGNRLSSGVGAKMNFQPSWNFASLCFLADGQCWRVLAIIKDFPPDCTLAAGFDRDRPRFGGRPIIPGFYAASLANDLKMSAYIAGSVLPTAAVIDTGAEELAAPGATV